MDLLQKIEAKNPNLLRDEFPDLIDPAHMPKQNLDRLYDNEIWEKDTDKWKSSSITDTNANNLSNQKSTKSISYEFLD